MAVRADAKRQDWGLPQAKLAAALVFACAEPAKQVRVLLREMAGRDALDRQCAADTVRRLSQTAHGLALLRPHATRLLDAAALALSEDSAEESGKDWRTSGHLMVVAARVCQTVEQRRRCAEMLLAYVEHPRTVLRANALEGLARLAEKDARLRDIVEPLLLRALQTGSAAERTRARVGLAALRGESG